MPVIEALGELPQAQGLQSKLQVSLVMEWGPVSIKLETSKYGYFLSQISTTLEAASAPEAPTRCYHLLIGSFPKKGMMRFVLDEEKLKIHHQIRIIKLEKNPSQTLPYY